MLGKRESLLQQVKNANKKIASNDESATYDFNQKHIYKQTQTIFKHLHLNYIMMQIVFFILDTQSSKLEITINTICCVLNKHF
jgi:hypothetical protein